MLSKFKSSRLKIFDARRFHAIKAGRDTMNQMLGVRKKIPSVSNDVSSSPQPQSSPKENASDERYPRESRNSRMGGTSTVVVFSP